MFSSKIFLLCLVALFTSIALSLSLTPSSSILLDLVDSETLTGTTTTALVSRQDGSSQRQLFCRYNPTDCQKQFPEYCTDMTKPSPEWCDALPTNVAQLNARIFDILTDDNSLVSRQESPDVIKKKQLEFCRQNFVYCDDLCGDLNHLQFCDDVLCVENSSYCREEYGDRCRWGGPWWCDPKATPPALDGEATHDKVAVDAAAIPPPPSPSAEATVTATVTKEFMVPEQTPVSSVVQSATPSATSTGGDEDDSMSKEDTQSLVKRVGWYCLWLCD
ncbi:hypothetical protein KCU98_g4480, partial [Aureobasidium melanogenum]